MGNAHYGWIYDQWGYLSDTALGAEKNGGACHRRSFRAHALELSLEKVCR